jgi:serine/threonine-protein kinase HipA
MAIYAPTEETSQAALRKRAERGGLRPLYRGVYTDELDSPEAEIVRENILAIAAVLAPDYQLSHRSAAVRGLVGDLLFMSGPGKPGRHIDLPGARIVRLPALPAPEYDRVPAPTGVIRGTDGPAEEPYIRISTPLQTIFECLGRTRAYAEKALPDEQIAELISRLSETDRQRAERFAVRNGLRREYLRYQQLSFGIAEAETIRLAEPEATELYYYGWRVGRLVYLGAGEYQFTYDDAWPMQLSKQLPLRHGSVSYEGRRMPSFFENCLPEGWTESVVLASNKLSREDLFGLLTTTRKYLSNFTLRPLGIPDADLIYDALEVKLDDLLRTAPGTVQMVEAIGEEPADPLLWRKTRADGPLRLSGVQAKLPVSLTASGAAPALRLGDLRNPCTHILKVPAHEHPGLIENEWATMELARRIGLPVAPVAMVEFAPETRYRGRSLLVERYDIPTRAALDQGGTQLRLGLQEDACSLLLLRRDEKYATSYERIAAALLDAGLSREVRGDGMWRYLQVVLFSWMVGNGDLHAKNISVLRRFRPGRPGEPPVLEHLELTPFYDLVNTRLHIPNDDFALPLEGRRANLSLRDVQRLAARWDTPKDAVRREAERMAGEVQGVLPSILEESGLPREIQDRYRGIVNDNVRSLVGA